MAEMNGPHAQPGSQPASGGINSGSLTGGFEMMMSNIGLGGGAGLSPPGSTVGGLSMTDVTLEQALSRMQDLMRENAELREYLKENNEMMKRQFDTLSQWKQKVHNANVLNREKFEQTRALITALRSENEELQVKIRDSTNKEELLSNKIQTLETQLKSSETAKAVSAQLAFNVVKQAEQQGVEVGEEETQMRETVYVASAEKEERIQELEAEVSKKTEELDQMKDRYANLEHDNSQFRSNMDQLFKDLESTQQLKQQIQTENQSLLQETVQLRQQVQSMLSENKNSLQLNQNPLLARKHLASHQEENVPITGNSGQEGAMGRMPDGTIDDWQEGSNKVTKEVEQLRKQLEAERHKTEAFRAEKAEKELEVSQAQGELQLLTNELESTKLQYEHQVQQLQRDLDLRVQELEHQKAGDSSMQQHQEVTATHAEDVQTLRSQVLTLINEVHETQNKLTAAQRTIETKNTRVKELETYSNQLVLESRDRAHQMQQALAIRERQLAGEQQTHTATKQQMNELRKSFNQLVSDYKEVLDTFDQYKAEQEQRMRSNSTQRAQMDTINHLTAQVVAAEEAINMREDCIKKLQADVREKEETMAVLQAQAEVFKSDFTAEREARGRLATEKERIGQELEAEQLKTQNLTDQLTRYTQKQLQDMQLRASQGSSAGQYLHSQPNFYPRAEPYQQVGEYVMGGGGDGGGGNYPQQTGNFNNLSMEGAQRAPAQQYSAGGLNYAGGQNHNHPQSHNYHAGQNYPMGQNYMGEQIYPGGQAYLGGQGHGGGRMVYAEGGDRRGVGQNAVRHPGQPSMPGGQQAGMRPQYQQHQGGGGVGAGEGGGAAQHDEEEHTLYICPSCEQRLPDYDTLAIHVQDCLEQNAGT